MPATSLEQQRLACAAYGIKLGKQKGTGKAAEMAKSMTLESLKHYCEAPIKKQGD